MTKARTGRHRDEVRFRSADDPAARTAAILGDGPRLAPVEIEGHRAELHAILLWMAQVNAALDSREKEAVTDFLAAGDQTDGHDPASYAALSEIVRTMVRHADLFAVQTDIGIQLLTRGALSSRDREMMILRIG